MIKAASKTSTDLFQQAVESFQTALRAGMQLQEDSAERYMEVLRDVNSSSEWKQGVPARVSKAIAATQESITQSIHFMSENAQNIAQSIRVMNESAEQTVGLMEKALRMQCGNSTLGEEDGYFWTYSLNAMKANVEILQQANARVLESWAQLAKDVLQRVNAMRDEVVRATEIGVRQI
jgi:hypothetical protein